MFLGNFILVIIDNNYNYLILHIIIIILFINFINKFIFVFYR